MFKKILVALFFFSSLVQAQYTIKGKMQPAESFNWVAVYQLHGAKQTYITNTVVNNGEFSFNMPKEQGTGIYRLIYNLENRLFIDILYDSENISFTFNPNYPNQFITFSESENNKTYHEYSKTFSYYQQQLDSLQIAYFKQHNKESGNSIKKAYIENNKKLKDTQIYYEQQSNEKLAQHFIKASAKYNSDEPLVKPIDYLAHVKTHFFDYINFEDSVLLNSSFLNDKINDFIFYVNTSDDSEMRKTLQKEAITTVINKVGSNFDLAKDTEEGLLYTFAQQEDISMANFVLNKYLQLPPALQDAGFVNDIKGQLKTSVGMKAPNITWQKSGTSENLYDLTDSEHYIIIFWSSTCSHCLKEMPVLYNFLKDNTQTKVIAVGLENDDSKTDWQAEIIKYPNFINVYGDNKWKNKFARAYGVNATPSYFVLDASKKIVAKPDDVKELKVFFSKN